MTVLVAGGCGYIGSHTCLEFLEQGFDVVAVDNLCNSSAEALRRVEELTGKKLAFYPVDVRDREAVSKIFEAHPIDCVIQFAGLKAVGESVQKPLEYYDNNLNATLSLCEVMGRFGVKRMIFSSSATVYGENNPSPYLETMPTGECSSPYGWTKLMSEKILQGVAHADPEWSVVLLRYFNPIGRPSPAAVSGEDPGGHPQQPDALYHPGGGGQAGEARASSATTIPPPTAPASGTISMWWIWRRAMWRPWSMPWSTPAPRSLIWVPGKGVSVTAAGGAPLSGSTECRCPMSMWAAGPGDLPAYFANADKARQVLGWQAELDIADMCRDSWNWQKHNPDGYPKETR